MSRRIGYIAALIMALTGCGTVVEEGSALGQTAEIFQPPQNSASQRFLALLNANAPVLQVGFVDLDTNGNLLLEHEDDDFAYWISPEGAQMILQSGMVHSTRGFDEGLLASELSEPLDLVLGLRSGWSDRLHTYLDGEDAAITRTFRCRIENQGPREINLFGSTVDTRLMRENCRSLDQDFTNLYWVAPSSRAIVLSRQWIGPEIGTVSTRIVPRERR